MQHRIGEVRTRRSTVRSTNGPNCAVLLRILIAQLQAWREAPSYIRDWYRHSLIHLIATAVFAFRSKYS